MAPKDTNKRLKIALVERGLDQTDLANRIGMNRSTLNMIVNNRIIPREDEKRAIAEALGKPIEELFAA